jgi:hypothetical protein
MSFVELVAKKGNKIVLFRGVSKDAQDFYCYIRSNEKQLFRMKQDYEQGVSCSDPKQYGSILYTGLGHEPDDAAKAFLKEYCETM